MVTLAIRIKTGRGGKLSSVITAKLPDNLRRMFVWIQQPHYKVLINESALITLIYWNDFGIFGYFGEEQNFSPIKQPVSLTNCFFLPFFIAFEHK